MSFLVRMPAAYFSCSGEGSICFWDATTFEPLPKQHQVLNSMDKSSTSRKLWPLSVTTLPAHSLVLVGCADRQLQVYDCTSHDLIRHVGSWTLEAEASAMCSWSSLGHDPKRPESPWRLGCGDRGGSVSVYDVNVLIKHVRSHENSRNVLRSSMLVSEFSNMHSDWVSCMSFAKHHDLGSLISGSLDSTICLIPLDKLNPRRTLRGHSKGVHAVIVIEQSVLMVSAGHERDIIVWSLAGCEPLSRLKGHLRPVMQLQLDTRNSEVRYPFGQFSTCVRQFTHATVDAHATFHTHTARP